MTKEEKIQKELIEKICKKLVHATMGSNGEMFGGGSEDFLDGLINAYRIVESFDPKPEPKFEEIFEKYKKLNNLK